MHLQFNTTRKLLRLAIVLTAAALGGNRAAAAVAAQPGEIAQRDVCLKDFFFGEKPQLPFSFLYGEKKSAELLAAWPKTTATKKLDAIRTQHTFTWTDPKTGLEVRCVVVEYANYPVAEWTVYFKNAGSKNTPILADIQALNAMLPAADSEPLLHHFRGDNCTKDSFEPFRTALTPGINRTFTSVGGRPSTGEWPYYNLEQHGRGIILAIGWPGQWKCQFTRNQGTGVRICAGQELTHFTLHPGEEVRTPLIALMFYGGDWISGQNLWRRWMLAENFPKDHGKPVAPKSAAFCGDFFPGYRTDRREVDFIDRYV
jgi:alpha-galactosidase